MKYPLTSIVCLGTSVEDVLDLMIAEGSRFVIVITEQRRVCGVCTFGDFLRVKKEVLSGVIDNLMNPNFEFCTAGQTSEQLVSAFLRTKALAIPILNESDELIDVVTPWDLLIPSV